MLIVLVVGAKSKCQNKVEGTIMFNPVFEIFFIDVEEVSAFSFAEGPKTYNV